MTNRNAIFSLATLRFFWSLDTRYGEALIGFYVLARGVVLMFPGVSMSEAIYSDHLGIAPEWLWGLITASAGFFILSGIIINGRKKHSPYLRAIGSAIAFVLYLVLTVTFYNYGSGLLSLAVWIYWPIAIGSFYAMANILSKT